MGFPADDEPEAMGMLEPTEEELMGMESDEGFMDEGMGPMQDEMMSPEAGDMMGDPDMPEVARDLSEDAAPSLLDAALLSATSAPNEMVDSLRDYVDSFDSSVSGLGRALFEMRAQAETQRNILGDGDFESRHANTVRLFRALGDTALHARASAASGMTSVGVGGVS